MTSSAQGVRVSETVAPAFHDIHRDIRSHDHTHYWLGGGRGSTKSSAVSIEIVMLILRNPDANAVVLRKVADTLRGSVYAQILWAIGMLGLDSKFHATTSPMEITYKPTGQRIVFRGLDKAEKVKSFKFIHGYAAIVWFEEIDQFSGMYEIRKTLQSLMRGGSRFWCFYSFNPPRSRDNWANKEVLRKREDRVYHASTYLDVPVDWLGEQFILEAEDLRDTNDTAYRNEYLGEVVGTGGNVFENVEVREIPDDELAKFDSIYNGVDFGWFPDPWVFVRCHYDMARKTLYIFDEATGVKLSNEATAEVVKAHLTYSRAGDREPTLHRDRVTCDSAEPKSVENYRALGLRAEGAIKGPGSREHGIKWLASRARIVIDPQRCPTAAEEFTAYEHERNKQGDYVTSYPDANNHTIDAIRYALEPVTTRRRNI